MSDQREALERALDSRYVLARELGRGGMATVYLAHDVRHDRDIGLKVLRPELAAALGRERFLAEIRNTARLDHPHILTLIDSGETGGLLWYVVPFVRGESLRQKLVRERQLALDEALAIARQVAGALDYAHRHGILHRDVKPENILLHEGEAMLADFGIARALDAAGAERLTESGLAMGTPSYMSPEQAAGGRELDGRSDLYALGCVTYEMLAGAPPFTGPTAQAILSRHSLDPVPPLRTVRAAVPEAVADAIEKTLAKVPADRFATVGEFAAALAPDAMLRSGKLRSGQPPRGARFETERIRALPGRTALLWAVAGAAVLGSAALLWSHRRPAAGLDADLIAVAPFDVLDPKLALWREGMVDILARSLDGAGALRTAAPSVVIKRWQGRADAASARALGEHTGAALVVYGSLVAAEHDSVRASVLLLDTRSGRSLTEIERRGAVAGMDRLVDSVAVALLTELGRIRPVGAFRGSGFGGRSLPALKAFLQGEQFLRVAQFDSALAAYHRAIALDSAFPQALRHAMLSAGYSRSDPFDPRYQAYARLVGPSNHGLGPRDSLLTLLDSTNWAVEPDPAVAWAIRRRAFATAEELVRRYPDDPEVWFQYGETRAHNGVGPGLQATDLERQAAFDRSIALDSGFAPAYEHAVGYALNLDGPARAEEYLAAFRRAMRREPPSAGIRLMQAILRHDRATFDRLLDSASLGEVTWAGTELANWPDSAEMVAAVWDPVGRGPEARLPFGVDSAGAALWRRFHLLLYRGHAREACASPAGTGTAPPGPWWPAFIAWCGLLQGLPADSAGRLLDRGWQAALKDGDPAVAWEVGYRALPWWAAERDTVRIAHLESWMESSLREHPILATTYKTTYVLEAVGAYHALARGDSVGALARLRTLPDSLCAPWPSCPEEVRVKAQLELALGLPRDALRTLEYSNLYEVGMPAKVSSALTRGAAAEQAGELELATRSYQFVAEAWRNADPALRPYVQQARDGLARLTREPRKQ